MTEAEDVAVVTSIYEAMDARDFGRLFDLIDPSVTIRQDARLPWGGEFEGHDGVATFALALTSTIDSRVAIDSIFAVDGDVVQMGHTRGTVRATGVPFDIAEVHRWTVRDGKAIAAHMSIDTPAMLDALAAEPERCEQCGFVWAAVGRDEIGPRVVESSRAIAALLRSLGDTATVRTADGVWSALEYAAHVRDVLYHLRDRLVIGLAEDMATFKPLYRDLRVEVGLYREEDPMVLAEELELAAALFARTFAVPDDEQLARPIVYGYPTEQVRTLLWLGQQTVHEVEHHRGDIEA